MARRARRKFEFDWDAEARSYALEVEHEGELGVPLDEGTDQLILDFLEKGDPQPLIHFLRNDHEFGPRLRHYLALMLDDTYPSFPPFRLIIEKRGNRRRRKHLFPRAASNQLRDNKAAIRAHEAIVRMRNGGIKGAYRKGIEQVAQEMGIDFHTVKKPYDRVYGKKRR